LDKGSSNRNTLGSRTIARPIATRWRWPPDSARGLRSSSGSSCSDSAARRTAASMSRFGRPAIFKAKPMFSATVRCG